MAGFGEKMEGEKMPEIPSPIIEENPQSGQDFKGLFEDDYEGMDIQEAPEHEQQIDPDKEYASLFEDDFEKKEDSDNQDNNRDASKDERKNQENSLDTNDKQNTLESNEQPEYDEDGTRELTEDEKQMIKDKLGWSDEKIAQKCRIDKDGVVHFKCRSEKGNDSGIEYEKKTIEINGVKIEVTVPKFDSKFDTQLSEENYESSNSKQFSECNKKLKEAIENDPELKAQFTDEQLEDIANGDTPRGYTWHHNEEPGKMQLVKTEDHDQCIGGAPHTGGNSLWGNKAREKTQEGVQF